MRRARSATLLAAAALTVLLAACGSPAPKASPTSQPAADLPPAWVQHEVAWQALAARDAHPRICQWTLATASRARKLDPGRTSYLRSYPDMAYVLIVRGDFVAYGEPSLHSHTMYLVIRAAHHDYIAFGFLLGPEDLSKLGTLNSYTPQLPLSSGVWGHTMIQGGAFPGGPSPITGVNVAVWKGDRSATFAQPLKTVRSDAEGFFTLGLPPGVYTFKFTDPHYHSLGQYETVTVTEGQPTAARVFVDIL